jgi:hypothetical protein
MRDHRQLTQLSVQVEEGEAPPLEEEGEGERGEDWMGQ